MSKENNWLPSEKNVEDFLLMKGMLNSQKKEFDLLSKKKTTEQLNPMKIKMVNRVLKPLKELLIHEKSHDFLDILIEDDMPTNSDVVLIISQYETSIINFTNKYKVYDKYDRRQRWMTKEYPPDYYADYEEE